MCIWQVVFVADGSGYVPITQLRARPGLHPDDLDYHHVAPIEAWDRDYSRWRFNTTRVQRRFMLSAWRLTVVSAGDWILFGWKWTLFLVPDTVNIISTIESFIYPTDAQIGCSKNVKIYIKIYMRGAATCFGFSQPSSGSYCMCFARVISINLLNPTGHVMHHQFNIQQLYVLPTLYLCVLYLSENKQRLVTLTA